MRLASLFTGKHNKQHDENSPVEMRRQWDALRRNAITPAERAEIDAMFSRSMP